MAELFKSILLLLWWWKNLTLGIDTFLDSCKQFQLGVSVEN